MLNDSDRESDADSEAEVEAQESKGLRREVKPSTKKSRIMRGHIVGFECGVTIVLGHVA